MGIGDVSPGAGSGSARIDTLGTLMILHACAEGLFLAGVLFLIGGLQPPDQTAATAFVVLGMGLAALLAFAGFMVLERRRRGLAAIVLGLNVSMLLTGWCAPTAVALALYGLSVLTRDEVVAAFEAS